MDIPTDVESWCDHLESTDADIGAFVPEPDRHRRIRVTVDDLARRHGAGALPLYRVPVGVKDIIHVAGLPTAAGSDVPVMEPGGPQASVVTALRDAGAVVAGKTVTAEFAQSAPGGTRNPRDRRRTPGGSSSGSAAAVAAGAVPLAVGTQTIGSMIRPGAYCGVIALKPGYDRVSRDGVIANSPSLDTVGFFASDLELLSRCCGAVVPGWRSVIGGGDPVLGVPTGDYLRQAGREATEVFADQVRRLRAAGLTVREVPLFDDIAALNAAHHTINRFEFAYQHRYRFRAHQHLYRAESAEFILRGQETGVGEYDRALDARDVASHDYREHSRAHGVQLWISPPATGPAPIGITGTGDPSMNLPWTHVGAPVLQLPDGTGPSAMPMGLQLATIPGTDEELLAWAPRVAAALALDRPS